MSEETINNSSAEMIAKPNNLTPIADLNKEVDEYAEYLNRGMAFFSKGLYVDALGIYKKALRACPSSLEALSKIAQIYANINQPEKAIKTLRRIKEIEGDDMPLGLRVQLLELSKKFVDWDSLEEDFAFFKNEEILKTGALVPFVALSNPLNNRELYLNVKAYTKTNRWFQPKVCPFDFSDRKKGKKKLRLGFMSGDLRLHPVGYVLSEFFELIDRKKFDVYLYDTHPEENNETHKRIYSTTENITDIEKLSDRDAAQKIFDDKIDVMIDLSGYTAYNRLGVLTYQPAPAQGTFLGFLGSLGAIPGVDYNFADEYALPPDQQKYYGEKIKYVTPAHRIIDRKMELPLAPLMRSHLGFKKGTIVLSCFNNTYKYTPEYFDLWARILKRVPNAVLWFYTADSYSKKNILKEFIKREIEEEQVVFTDYMPHVDHLARYKVADLLLDTQYYNAHTTAMEALYMGCPMITCPGETFTSRAGGALMQALEMPEMIVKDLKEYEEKVVKLCTTEGALKKLREKVTQKAKTAPLFDTNAFAKSFEKACREMYDECVEELNGED